jgi:hypothetical protein
MATEVWHNDAVSLLGKRADLAALEPVRARTDEAVHEDQRPASPSLAAGQLYAVAAEESISTHTLLDATSPWRRNRILARGHQQGSSNIINRRSRVHSSPTIKPPPPNRPICGVPELLVGLSYQLDPQREAEPGPVGGFELSGRVCICVG